MGRRNLWLWLQPVSVTSATLVHFSGMILLVSHPWVHPDLCAPSLRGAFVALSTTRCCWKPALAFREAPETSEHLTEKLERISSLAHQFLPLFPDAKPQFPLSSIWNNYFHVRMGGKEVLKLCGVWCDNSIRFWWLPAWPCKLKLGKVTLGVLLWYLIFCASAAGGGRRLERAYSNLSRNWMWWK